MNNNGKNKLSRTLEQMQDSIKEVLDDLHQDDHSNNQSSGRNGSGRNSRFSISSRNSSRNNRNDEEQAMPGKGIRWADEIESILTESDKPMSAAEIANEIENQFPDLNFRRQIIYGFLDDAIIPGLQRERDNENGGVFVYSIDNEHEHESDFHGQNQQQNQRTTSSNSRSSSGRSSNTSSSIANRGQVRNSSNKRR
jgi:hypothetical protein